MQPFNDKGSTPSVWWPLLFIVIVLGCGYFLFRTAPPPNLFKYSDKLFHFGGFLALIIAGFSAFRPHRWKQFAALAAVLILAVVAELLHGSSLLPERNFDLLDLSANLAGCGVGLLWVSVANRISE